MSKLAHSDEKTMDELDRQRAIADGNEDLLPTALPPQCQPRIVERLRRTASFIAQQTGAENSRWVSEAADEIASLTKRAAVYEASIRDASAALRKASLTDNERIADAQIALNRAALEPEKPL
jgi:hypothetical protein